MIFHTSKEPARVRTSPALFAALAYATVGLAVDATIDQAWQKLPSYRVGADQTCLLQLDEHIGRTTADATRQAQTATRLANLLTQPRTTDDAKLFICRQLARIGSDAEVAAIATLLKKGEPRDTQMACVALVGINSAGARETLRNALADAQTDAAPDLIQAIGALRDGQAVALLSLRLQDPNTAETALSALSEIATDSCATTLAALETTAAVLDAQLRCAERLNQQTDTRRAAQKLYESVWKTDAPVHVRTAALRGLIASGHTAAVNAVTSALQSDNARLAATAAMLLPDVYAQADFEQLLEQLRRLPPSKRTRVIEISAEQGQVDALPLAEDALTAKEPELVLAAVRALGHLGNDTHVRSLAELAARNEGKPVATAATESLVLLKADSVNAGILKGLLAWDTPTRAVLTEVAARRQIPGVSTVLLDVAEKTPDLRRKVYSALAQVGGPEVYGRLVPDIKNEMDDPTRKDLEAALAHLAAGNAGPLVMLWHDAGCSAEAKASVLRILARIGGSTGLPVVRAALERSDDLRREAIRALANWADASAVDDLLALQKQKEDPAGRALSNRGLMKLVDRGNLGLQRKLEVLDALVRFSGDADSADWAEKRRAAALNDNAAGTALTPVAARSTARKQQLVERAPKGYRLVAYIDCGPDTSDGTKGGPSLRAISGAPYVWSGAHRHADVRAATIIYTGDSIKLEAAGLDSGKSYALGLTWWDYDHSERVQSVVLSGQQVLKPTALPSHAKDKAVPAEIGVPVPAKAYARGTMPIEIRRAGGVNTVLSEIWLYESDEAPPVAKPKPRDPNATRVLLITGEDYPGHKWQETAPVLFEELAKDKRLAVDLIEDLSLLRTTKLSDYASVVMHFKNYDPQVPGRAGYDNLATYVKQGGGLVLVHFACGAFQEFKDEFVNVGGRVWNPKMRGHDPFGEFTVSITKPDHPCMVGLEDFQTTDELYTCLDGETPITVLAGAMSKVDKKTYPMVFVLSHGKGRVFHSPLGHDPAALNNPPVAELFRRGTAWAAGLTPVRE